MCVESILTCAGQLFNGDAKHKFSVLLTIRQKFHRETAGLGLKLLVAPLDKLKISVSGSGMGYNITHSEKKWEIRVVRVLMDFVNQGRPKLNLDLGMLDQVIGDSRSSDVSLAIGLQCG